MNEKKQRASITGRLQAGFTMMEMLATVAIIVIVMAFAFISITNMMRNMQQAELDGTAKEIYIAAQNHLSQANSQTLLSRKTDPGTRIEDGIYCYAVSGDDPRLEEGTVEAKNSVLYQMLPYGSIDETVRTGGTYVIKYDLDSATVLSVFYARSEQSTLFGAATEGFAFSDADISVLYGDPGYEGDSHKADRQHYRRASGSPEVMIGYYAGEDLDLLDKAQLDKPSLRVVNAERLTAIVTNPNRGLDSGKPESERVNPALKLVVKGKTSNASKTITLYENGVSNTTDAFVHFTGWGDTFYVHLDDVTASNRHFADIFPGFLPGEDIDIQAIAYSNTRLSNIASSVKLRRNSLFSNIVAARGPADLPGGSISVPTVKVSNIRHLENLSSAISGYDPTGASWNGEGAWHVVQEQSMSWRDFREAIATNRSCANPLLPQVQPTLVRSYERSTSGQQVAAGSFMPVRTSFAMDYNGKEQRISDVVALTPSGNAGIFSALSNSTVANLVIENPDIQTMSGSAGALSGSASDGTVISNVLVCNTPADQGGDAAYEITATASAGGMVGQMDGGAVSFCAAAVYVRSSNGDAGGLIGSSPTSEVEFSNCYTGGHTSNGSYSDSIEENRAGRVNVIAAGNAGGLVGSGSFDIDDCYSTASAYGACAGGLAGQLTGSIANAYALGRVIAAPEGSAGTIAGNGAAATSANCQYVRMLNGDMPPDGSGTITATAVDTNTASFAAFTTSGSPAYSYDNSLLSSYQGRYPYKTLNQLRGADSPVGAPLHAAAHYGDWPRLGSMIVNQRG